MILFDDFALDADKQILYRGGEVVGIAPKAVGVLCRLAATPGEVVGKNELLETVWEGAFVEESNLAHQIYELRKYFKSQGFKYIETVPRRGYRFVGPVRKSEPAPAPRDEATAIGKKAPETDFDAAAAAPAPRGRPAIKALLFVAALAAAVSGLHFYYRSGERTGPAPIRSLAVLPMRTLPGGVDPSLRLRLADSLITRLGRLPELGVRPTSAVVGYVDSNDGAVEIGRRLGVDAVIDGNAREESGRLRVDLRLFSVESGAAVWAESFESQSGRLLELQDEIAAKLLLNLNFRLSREQQENFARRSTSNPDAYEAYLRGRYLWTLRNRGDLRRAVAEFEQAVLLDPKFALAYSGLGDCWALLSVYDELPPSESFPKAREYARMALAIDPNLAEAQATVGFIAYRFDWDWRTAAESLDMAVKLRPNYATAHHWRGELLNARGSFDEGEASIRRAVDLDPTSPVIRADLGYGLFLAGRYDAAEAELARVARENPTFGLSHYCLFELYSAKGMPQAESASFLRWMETTGADEADIARVRRAFDEGGQRAAAEARYDWAIARASRGYLTKFDVARYALDAGRRAEALDWLEKAAAERSADIIFVRFHPAFAPLRNDPRFVSVVTGLGLER